MFFMGLDPDGFVLRVIDGRSNAAQPPPYDPTLVPALPPAVAATAPFGSQELAPARPYGIGRQEISWLVGETLAPSQTVFEAGVRVGDVIGRLDTIALASLGSANGQRGVGIASAWRGWTCQHIYRSRQNRKCHQAPPSHCMMRVKMIFPYQSR